MAIRARVTLKGHEEIQNFLDMLPREVAGEHLREATLDAAEVIRKEAVQNALKHKRTGTLAEDVVKEIDEKKSTESRVVVYVGAGKKGWYGRLVETGHYLVPPGQTREARQRRKAGTMGEKYKWVPPHPWLRPAFDAKREEFRQRWIDELRKRMESLAGRTLKRR